MKFLTWIFPKTTKSKVNGKIRIGKRFGNQAIIVGGVTQSGGELIDMWEYVVDDLKKKNKNSQTCLVLGVGGGTVIGILQKKFPNLKITAIELDPVMIKLAKTEFGLKNDHLTILNSDAVLWCKKNAGKIQFDSIIVDLYIGRYNPKEIRKEEFLQTLKKLQTPHSTIYFNSHFHKKRKKEFEEFEEICESIFDTEIIYTFPYNKILLLRN